MPADSVLAKAPYKIPTIVDTDRICISVPCPNDPDHIANFLEALASLGLWSNYRLETDRIAKPVADVWEEIFRVVEESLCDCGLRNGPGGIEQFDHNSSTWIPIQGNSAQGDPRTDGTVTPPWVTPPIGQTGNCLAAANITESFRSSMLQTVGILGDLGGFATLLVSIEAFLALALPLIGEVIVIATEMAAGAIDAGAIEMAAAFSGSGVEPIYAALKCSINCFVESDGTVTTGIIAAIKDDFLPKLPGLIDSTGVALWTLFVTDFFDANGPNGLMKFGKLSNVVTSDCSGCDCGWCYEWNFLINDGGFTTGLFGQPASTWDSAGWHAGHDGSGSAQNFIHLTGLDVSTAEKLEVGYYSPVAWSGHASSFQQQTYESGAYQNYTVQGGAPLGDEVLTTVLNHHFDELIIDQQVSSDFGSGLDFIIKFVRLRGHGTPPTLIGGTTC
jgi:hypothetical protein